MQTEPEAHRSKLSIQLLCLLAVCCVAAFFFHFIYANTINIPYHDDIPDFLQFIYFVETAKNGRGLWGECYIQYLDHRTCASRLFVYLNYKIFGELDFSTLALMANASLLAMLGLYVTAIKDHRYSWSIVLIAALLLLHPRATEIVLWAQPTFAYSYSFLYSFVAIFAIHKVSSLRIIVAAAFCMAASLTFAAGQLVWAICGASLLSQVLFHKRDWRWLIGWTALSVAGLLAWRWGFTDRDIIEVFRSGDEAVFQSVLPNLLRDPSLSQLIIRFAQFFFTMLGAAMHPSSVTFAMLVGAALLLTLVAMSFRSLKSSDLRLLLCMWYSVATALAIVYGRASLGTADYILATRYSFISMVFCSGMAVLILSRSSYMKRWMAGITLAAAAGYWVWSFDHYGAMASEKIGERQALYNSGKHQLFGYPTRIPNGMVSRAVELGIWSPPCRPQPGCS